MQASVNCESPASEEGSLMLRAQRGDAEAFGGLVQLYMRRAYGAALSLVGSHEDALDLSQDAFARAFRARRRLDPQRPFYPWYYQILRRLCFNFVRDRRRRSGKLEGAASWLRSSARQRQSALRPDRQIAGYRVVRTLGLVRGNTIRARHLGKDILAFLKAAVGGEIEEYTKMMAESREQSIDRMVAEANSLGANAITDARFSTSYLMGSAAEILVFGNAVVVEALEEESDR